MPPCGHVERGLVIHTPDSLRAGAPGSAEQIIYERTGLVPMFRFLRRIDRELVRELYRGSLIECTPRSQLVEYLYSQGPSLCAVYEGDGCCLALRFAKGGTHPAIARPDTVRGGLLCDNEICNLMHTSDDAGEAARELALLLHGVQESALIPCTALLQRHALQPTHVALQVLCSLVNRGLHLRGESSSWPDLQGSSASAAVRMFREWLVQQKIGGFKADVLERAYFQGAEEELLAQVEQFYPPSEWELFVLRCGVQAAALWNRTPIGDVLEQVGQWLANLEIDCWAIAGSSALWALGAPVTPNDIDVRCSEFSLDKAMERTGIEVVVEHEEGYRARVLKVVVGGWAVELVGDLVLDSGKRLAMDTAVAGKRNERGIMAIEDLLVEYLTMNRPKPHNDLQRARMCVAVALEPLNQESICARLADPSLFEHL